MGKFMGFIGVFRDYALDSKGRVSLPAEFREQIKALGEESVVIMKGLGNYLIIMPHSTWMKEMEDISSSILSDPKGSKDLTDLWRYLSLGAFKKEIDRYGRVMIPKELRKRVSIDRRVSFVGLTAYIEVWDPEMLIKHEVFLESKLNECDEESFPSDLGRNIIYANLFNKGHKV